MFDSVSQAPPVPPRRRLGALLFAMMSVALPGLGALTAEAQTVESVQGASALEITYLADAAPDLPQPPPARAASPAGAPTPIADASEGAATPDAAAPTATPAAESADAGAEPRGGPPGAGVGGPGGEGPPGVGGPAGGGGAGPGIRAVHISELRFRKQVRPKTPEAALALGMEADCRLRLFIDVRGLVQEVRVESCPAVYQDAAIDAARGSSFYPYRVDGVAEPAQFLLTYKFLLR